jgi:dTDP-4-amino-4,6-dideoxygalactose transaminase
MRNINMSYPDLNDDDRSIVQEVLKTPNLSMGKYIGEFEKIFCDLTGFKHAIGVNSGTSGLHLCVRALDIQAGDLVITTPFSFVSSTNVMLFEKAIPVYVDVDPQTGNMDTTQLAEAADDLVAGGARAQKWLPRHLPARGWDVQGSLKALLPIDVFGQPADYDLINPVADRFGLQVIEDSCEALGAEYKGRKAGTLGNCGVFAFYPNKQITTGEGGMIITNDDHAADLMRALRNQGRAPGDTWLDHTYLGYNYRLDEMSAALGVSQMARLEELLTNRQQVADWYEHYLSAIDEVEAPILVESTSRVSWFVYVVRLSKKIDRTHFAEVLKAKGIPVRPYFSPIHLQPFMRDMFGYGEGNYPVTEDLGARSLAVPFSGKMTEDEVAYVCQEIAKAVNSPDVLH